MSENSDNFMLGDIQISPQHNTMSRGELVCRLQPKVMALLHYLHKNNERVIGNDELLEQVWEGRVVTHNSIQKSVNALRAAFAEFDPSAEYVVYFSKRGYQLVTANKSQANTSIFSARLWSRPLVLLALVGVTLTVLYLAYFFISSTPKSLSSEPPLYLSQFTQVKPYVSNTGRERIIEPHTSSTRVAFIRDEPVQGGDTESRLFIQGGSGLEWQMSVARGQFVDLAWSASGRNLVAVDVHNGEAQALVEDSDEARPLVEYYTFHIFTLDFKGEKLIEKNLLSHWLGKVSSVAWWDEGTMEFVASQGIGSEPKRYHYNIAEQNLTELVSQQGNGQLVATQVFNNQVAEMRFLDSAVQIQLFNQQQLIFTRTLAEQIVSMSWMSDGSGLLLLSDAGQLLVIDTAGNLQDLHYAPKLDGRISRARSTDKGNSLVLTVESSVHNANMDNEESALRFMAKGGGFIYTATSNQ
jgi:DNA-binding winged helix-turn-helix (wHTH) protein